MAKNIRIHCIHLQHEGDWSPEEIGMMEDIHEKRGCPPRRILWVEKDDLEPGRGLIFIQEPYPDRMDGERALSLQDVIERVWPDSVQKKLAK